MKFLAGSPGYVPPEVLKGAPHRETYDVYSCGATLFFMLTGELPYPEHQLSSMDYK